MQTKNRRKRAIIIAVATLAIGAAVAIPVGIVFGTRTASTESYDRLDRTTVAAETVAIRWGESTATLTAPAVPGGQGFQPSDYETGTYQASGYVSGRTDVGATGLNVTFEYAAKASTGKKPLRVTFPLRVDKATAPAFSATDTSENVEYGDGLKPFDFAQWLVTQKHTGYVVDAAKPATFTDDQDVTVVADAVRSLAVGRTVTATYSARLDTDHYEANGSPTGTYRIVYTVVAKSISPPTAPQGESITITLKDPFVWPEAKSALANFALDPAAPVTKVTERPADAVNAPAVDAAIDRTKVGTYEVGTKFTVVYAYVPAANYTGDGYKYTFSYSVGTTPATQPTDAEKVQPPGGFQYGKYTDTGAPTAPALGNGYTGTVAPGGSVVTAQSTVAGANSPAVGATFDWSKASAYNAGTKVKVTFTYKPATGYTGSDFTVEKEYVIAKQTVAVPGDSTRTATTFAYGTGVATITAPVPGDTGAFALTGTKYYQTVGGVKTERTAAQINALAADAAFAIEWTYGLNSGNYAPSAGTATSYKVSQAFTVSKSAASYTGNVTYDQTERAYQTGFANTAKTDLPEPTLNTGYVYDSVSYRITTASNDGVTRVGDIANLDGATTYGAGTTVTATYTFKPDANHTGADVTATHTLVVTKKAATVPTTADRIGGNTNVKFTTAQAQPTTTKTFTGYKAATYGSAKVTAGGAHSFPLADRVVSNWSEFNTYNVGTVVTVTYNLDADTDNYSGVTGPITYTETFTVTKADAVLPTDAEKTAVLPSESAYGTSVTAPTAGPALGTGYTSSLTSAVVTKQSTVTGTNSPAVGTTADWTALSTYNAGTEVTATFTYTLDDVSYAGTTASFTFTRTYIVTKAAGTKPTLTYSATSYTHGSTFDRPTPQTSNGTGYDDGTLSKAKFTVKGTRDDMYSPAVDTDFDWTLTDKYNAGAQVTLTYTYTVDGNHTGDDAEFTQTVTVNRRQMPATYVYTVNSSFNAQLLGRPNYKKGDPLPATYPGSYYFDDPDVYTTTFWRYKESGGTTTYTAAQVMAFPVGRLFEIWWKFTVRTDNTIPNAGVTAGDLAASYTIVA